MSKQRISIKLNGMTCNHCVTSVERLINNLEGIYDVQVSLDAGVASALIDPFKTDKEKLMNFINENSNYKAS